MLVVGTNPQRRRGARIALAACVLPLVLFAPLAAAAVYEPTWDGHLRQVLLRHLPEMPGNDDAVSGYVVLAGIFLTALALGVSILRKRPRSAFLWVLAIAGVAILDPLLKDAFERPSTNPDSSAHAFPSGHAMYSMAFVMACVLTAPRRWRLPLIFAGACFLIAWGSFTIQSQAHYPSDVVAGWCVAFAWTAAVWLFVIPRVLRLLGGAGRP